MSLETRVMNYPSTGSVPILSVSSSGQRDIICIMKAGKTPTFAGAGLSYIDLVKHNIKLLPGNNLAMGIRAILSVQSPWSPIPEFIPTAAEWGKRKAVIASARLPVIPLEYDWRPSKLHAEQTILSTGNYLHHGQGLLSS